MWAFLMAKKLSETITGICVISSWQGDIYQVTGMKLLEEGLDWRSAAIKLCTAGAINH